MLENGQLHGDCMTVTGKTIAENIADLPGLKEGQVPPSLILPMMSCLHHDWPHVSRRM